MAILVRDVLAAPLLGDARLIAGAAGLDREVSWTAVIEWQAADFVHEGELVLTTGVGLDEPQLTELLGQIIEAGAAALCVSLPPSGPVSGVPETVINLANQRNVPVIDLPWEVAFADVSRWAVDELIRRRFDSSIDEPDRLYARFAKALLAGGGMDGVAGALEAALDRPVLVFDARLLLAGCSPLATTLLGANELQAIAARAAELSSQEARAIARELDSEEPRRLEQVAGLGLGPGVVRTATARHETHGFLYVLDVPVRAKRHALASLEVHALEQAAAAVAMESLRRWSSIDDHAREDFLWQVAMGTAGPPDRVVARAALLGFDARATHELAVARLDGRRRRGGEARQDTDAGRAAFSRLARAFRERAAHAALRACVGIQDDVMVVVLATSDDRPASLSRLLATLQPDTEASWGIASMPRRLHCLNVSYLEAELALRVGTALHGAGSIADASELAPYMMLERLASDEHAMAIARRVVEPLLAYDQVKGRNLVETLDVYLAESGNTSSAARRLFLNRGSLAYRLRKIEELTGRDLDEPADRFVLDLSVKLLRFGLLDGDR